MLSYAEQKSAVDAAIAALPPAFGLRKFPGKTFEPVAGASYVAGDGRVLVYLYVHTPYGLEAFVKGTVTEIRREMTEPYPNAPTFPEVNALNEANCRAALGMGYLNIDSLKPEAGVQLNFRLQAIANRLYRLMRTGEQIQAVEAAR